MSEPAPPDGTDPRVVTPDADEPTVRIAHGYSTGKTYHTTECPTVKRMDAVNTVPKSVAEWKDYTKCRKCRYHEDGEGYDHPGRGTEASPGQRLSGVDAIRCLQIRTLLLQGATQTEVGEQLGVGKSTVGRHARGACECVHHGRTVAFDRDGGYEPVEDEGVPKHITGYAPIDEGACATMRQGILCAGVTANGLADVLGVSHSALRRHARAECDHDHDTPAAVYDEQSQSWVPAEGER